MRSENQSRSIWRDRISLGILFFALVLRLAAAHQWQSMADREGVLFRFGDSDSYWVLAGRLAHGEPYEYGGPNSKIFRAPLYPIVLAPCRWIEDPRSSVMMARYLGCVLGTITVGLVMMAAKRLGGLGAARLAGVAAACYPGAMGMSVFVLSEAIFCPLIACSLLAWSMRFSNSSAVEPISFSKRALGWALVSGAATGLACLARPSWILWPGVLLAMGAMTPRKARWVDGVALMLAMIAVMSPWWWRNFMVTGTWIPTTLQVGASLYDGWHPNATGSSDEGMLFSEEFASKQAEEDAEAIREGRPLVSTMEYRLDRKLFSAAISWARENPSDVIRLGVLKSWKTWSPFPTASQVGNAVLRWSEALSYMGILFFAALGIGIERHRWRLMIWYGMPCFYYGALHFVFVGSIRYRQPAVLMLCVIAGVGAIHVWHWIQSRSKALPN
ncbi:MAG: hypothetical protein U0905_08220 [Pirellulales bacterium]